MSVKIKKPKFRVSGRFIARFPNTASGQKAYSRLKSSKFPGVRLSKVYRGKLHYGSKAYLGTGNSDQNDGHCRKIDGELFDVYYATYADIR